MSSLARKISLAAMVCALLVAVAWMVALRRDRDPSGAQKNVLFILLDTIRADRLSCYGNERPTTPSIDRVARSGAQFLNAQSTAPWTIPSVASLWTGVQPSIHGAGIPTQPKRFADEKSFVGFNHEALPNLPTRLQAKGYTTFAYIANPLLNKMDCFLDGFDHVKVGLVKGRVLTQQALEWIPALEQARPFFLYLQFMDAHQPLEPPARYRDLFPTDGKDRAKGQYAFWDGFWTPKNMTAPGLEAFRATRFAVYDGALRFMDDQIGQILQQFQYHGLLDNTVVVITADHGEEFWEHGVEETELYDVSVRPHVGVGHGQTQFQELLHVPLVIAGPGINPTRISKWVSLIDLPATIMDVAAGDPHYEYRQSQSLGPLLHGEDGPRHPSIAEETSFGWELKALIDQGGMKYIMTTHPGERDSLFDLNVDPAEKQDLLARRPDEVQRIRALFTRVLESAQQQRVAPGESSTISPGVLNGLGYVK